MTDWRARKGPIGVLTGAGISTDSGIPDFRGPRGVWTADPIAELLSTYQNYVADPELRVRAWLARRDNPAWRATPHPAHEALVRLAASGRQVGIITQNIDRLHQRAGSGGVVEIHGNMFEVVCIDCDFTDSMTTTLERVAAGDPDPACPDCGGILTAAVVMFGQQLDTTAIRAAVQIAESAEIFLAVGSSLQVEPAASMCAVAVDAGADLVIVNAEPTPYDDYAAEIVRDPIGAALPRLVSEILGA
ncbi:SIR2 family NAD-dependent protein deacylase [Nocardia seriolae]|uniref:SIR2 family NAD-dependent protein deacylase n=1 Tax=Nocardia seriolae TaxID=37332 RepID=UPI0003F3E170|nr:Sir2 family NAD-dependent protein deacetylase [Nocardia seriolae]MTJ66514.1 NAD-dependent deacetylase [Nocardia seriolae]MTJ70607.1 NAD-dependent deacetylase [Nocardia seriolae]MTJ85589.1 NAD-dependent deacetylase [Nocardia seriolae]MTK29586.1 NAD-dependent deacetylase [Nocardia seriolae]MTK44503.1 NAD-dependent deacetylase [Nocardia seriolae]